MTDDATAELVLELVLGPDQAEGRLVRGASEVFQAVCAIGSEVDGGLEAFDVEGLSGAHQRDPARVLDAVRGCILAVCGEGRGARVARMTWATEGRSVLTVGRGNALLSPVLWLPEGAALDAPPSARLTPRTAREARRYVGAGAWITHWLTREWIDLRGRAPLGLPTDGSNGDYITDPAAWEAVGVPRVHSPLLIPVGHLLAQLSPERARELPLPAFTPVFGVLPGGDVVA